jgi:hypothetical protein
MLVDDVLRELRATELADGMLAVPLVHLGLRSLFGGEVQGDATATLDGDALTFHTPRELSMAGIVIVPAVVTRDSLRRAIAQAQDGLREQVDDDITLLRRLGFRQTKLMAPDPRPRAQHTSAGFDVVVVINHLGALVIESIDGKPVHIDVAADPTSLTAPQAIELVAQRVAQRSFEPPSDLIEPEGDGASYRKLQAALRSAEVPTRQHAFQALAPVAQRPVSTPEWSDEDIEDHDTNDGIRTLSTGMAGMLARARTLGATAPAATPNDVDELDAQALRDAMAEADDADDFAGGTAVAGGGFDDEHDARTKALPVDATLLKRLMTPEANDPPGVAGVAGIASVANVAEVASVASEELSESGPLEPPENTLLSSPQGGLGSAPTRGSMHGVGKPPLSESHRTPPTNASKVADPFDVQASFAPPTAVSDEPLGPTRTTPVGLPAESLLQEALKLEHQAMSLEAEAQQLRMRAAQMRSKAAPSPLLAAATPASIAPPRLPAFPVISADDSAELSAVRERGTHQAVSPLATSNTPPSLSSQQFHSVDGVVREVLHDEQTSRQVAKSLSDGMSFTELQRALAAEIASERGGTEVAESPVLDVSLDSSDDEPEVFGTLPASSGTSSRVMSGMAATGAFNAAPMSASRAPTPPPDSEAVSEEPEPTVLRDGPAESSVVLIVQDVTARTRLVEDLKARYAVVRGAPDIRTAADLPQVQAWVIVRPNANDPLVTQLRRIQNRPIVLVVTSDANVDVCDVIDARVPLGRGRAEVAGTIEATLTSLGVRPVHGR